MTTAIAQGTWPSPGRLGWVELKFREAHNALDELTLITYRVGNDLDALDGGAALPTFEQLGQLGCLIACLEQDLDGMQRFLDQVQDAYHAAAVRMELPDAR